MIKRIDMCPKRSAFNTSDWSAGPKNMYYSPYWGLGCLLISKWIFSFSSLWESIFTGPQQAVSSKKLCLLCSVQVQWLSIFFVTPSLQLLRYFSAKVECGEGGKDKYCFLYFRDSPPGTDPCLVLIISEDLTVFHFIPKTILRSGVES